MGGKLRKLLTGLPLDVPFLDDHLAVVEGDCRQVLPSLPAKSIDLILTDPPYGVNYQGNLGNKQKKLVGDDGDLSWLGDSFREMYRVLRNDRFAVTFYGWPRVEVFVDAFVKAGFRRVSHLVCVKESIGLGSMTRNAHECAFLLAKGKPAISGKAISDVLPWRRVSKRIHPSEKPLATLLRLVEAFSGEGDLVLDPFMGSASALEAADLMGRDALGIEIDPDHVRRAVLRLKRGNLFRDLQDTSGDIK